MVEQKNIGWHVSEEQQAEIDAMMPDEALDAFCGDIANAFELTQDDLRGLLPQILSESNSAEEKKEFLKQLKSDDQTILTGMGLEAPPNEQKFTREEAIEVFVKSVFNECLLTREEVADAIQQDYLDTQDILDLARALITEKHA